MKPQFGSLYSLQLNCNLKAVPPLTLQPAPIILHGSEHHWGLRISAFGPQTPVRPPCIAASSQAGPPHPWRQWSRDLCFPPLGSNPTAEGSAPNTTPVLPDPSSFTHPASRGVPVCPGSNRVMTLRTTALARGAEIILPPPPHFTDC